MESSLSTSAVALRVTRRTRRQAVGRVTRLAVALIATFSIASCSGAQDDERWSALPHSMGCTVTPFSASADASDPSSEFRPLPDALRVEHVTVTHRSGSSIELSLQFLHQPPAPASTSMPSPITGDMVDGPGSTSYAVMLHNNGTAVSLASPRDGKQWTGSSFANDRTVPVSATTQGNVVTVTANLESQQELLGSGPFKPTVSVLFSATGNPNPYAATGSAFINYETQDCNWDTASSGASGRKSGQVPDATASGPGVPPRATANAPSVAAPAPGSAEDQSLTLACAPGKDINILCPNEQTYINTLAALGITPKTTPRNLVNSGNQFCGHLVDAAHRYPSPNAGPGIKDGLASMIMRNNQGFTWAQARGWVQAAIDNLCPDRITGMHYQ